MAKTPAKSARKAPVRTKAGGEEKAAQRAATAASGEERKAAVEEQFAAADAKADPEVGLRRAVGLSY
jgi:hypothetical protein